jgi:hypothetical protein
MPLQGCDHISRGETERLHRNGVWSYRRRVPTHLVPAFGVEPNPEDVQWVDDIHSPPGV